MDAEESSTQAVLPVPRRDATWFPMPLNDEEWRAFINEYNGVMRDVEEALAATLEGNRLHVEALARDSRLPLQGEAILDTLREGLVRIQERLNAYGRRLLQMREAGEL